MFPEPLEHYVDIKLIDDIDNAFKAKWIKLFCATFNKSAQTAHRIFEKYTLNDGIFSAVFIQDELVACYSGIKMKSLSSELKFFLSTDTMSNGRVKSASILAAQELYRYLRSSGLDIVCGYPNEKIYGIRINKLKWSYLKNINLFLKIPFMDTDKAELVFNASSINLERPARHFFSSSIPGVSFYTPNQGTSLVTLFMSDRDCIRGFINLSKFFGLGQRKFCYKFLDLNSTEILTHDLKKLKLTHRSIDVP